MKSSSTADCVAIILAAGESRRMGRDKASLPWLNDKPLLEWMVESLSQNGWKPIVVLGPHNHEDWIGRLPTASLVLNPQPADGKVTSLIAGVKALPEPVHSILLTAVDQPRPPALYRVLRESSFQHSEPVIVPGNSQSQGHPVVLKQSLRERLLSLNEETMGLRGLLNDHFDSTYRLSCDASWLRWDFNDTVAYENALQWFKSHAIQSETSSFL